MYQKIRPMLSLILFVCLVLCLSACQKNTSAEDAIPTPIPPTSDFSKIGLGWSQKRVHDTIGSPTDTRNYITGKAFIPFYFGSDNARVEDLYKGEGRIIYAGGSGIGSQGYTVFKIIYDPNESGYNDKQAFPDGPQNAKVVEAPKPAPQKIVRQSKKTKAPSTSSGSTKDPLSGL